MKKILVVVMALLFAVDAYAVIVDIRVSANTVTFNSVDFERNRGPQIVTFNSVTNYIRMTNLSKSVDAYADIRCVDSNGVSGYATEHTAKVLLPAIGNATPNTVELNFATKNIAFVAVSDSSVVSISNSPKINYVVTGDRGDL